MANKHTPNKPVHVMNLFTALAGLMALSAGQLSAQQHKTLSSYSSQGTITASGSITLTPGFEVSSGSSVHVYIIPAAATCESLTLTASSGQNYILANTMRVSGITNPDDLSGRTTCQVNQSIQYFDGLGRPVQAIQVQGSPSLKDIVAPAVYDAFGREAFKYLPYASTGSDGSFRSGVLAAQASFHSSPPGGVSQNTHPYAETQFEPSPLNRPLKQGAPGYDWQPEQNHAVQTAYGANGSSEVKLWVISSGTISWSSYYSANALYKTTLTDENGTRSIEFKDKEGKVLLKQAEASSNTFISTYYVYDDFGNLAYVIPPGMTLNSFAESTTEFGQFVYAYHYDGRNRVIEKKIPGKGWEELVYNPLDQVVFTRDANRAAAGQWLYTKYDGLGRVIITGVENNTHSRSSLQGIVSGQSVFWESRDNGSGTGYTNNTAPSNTSAMTNLVINYYDDYTFPGGNTYSYSGSDRTQGLLTGTKVNVLGTSDKLLSVNFYDYQGQVVKSFSQHYQGGSQSTGKYDEVTNTYSFTGELLTSTRNHVLGGSTQLTALTELEYDHAGRKRNTWQTTNSGTRTLLSQIDYNELGQLSAKKLHSTDEVNYLQTVNYTYNERGWLKTSSAPLFAMELKYQDGSGSTMKWNGNITNQYWGTPGSLGNVFTYSYDMLSRLTSGSSTGISMSEVLTYDNMGNIATLNRDGASTTSTYSYTGNMLSSISGSSVATVTNYVYDGNGNATTDGRLNKTISYNILNLPASVSGGPTYLYDATGVKLRKVSSATTDYIGGIQYTGGSIEFIRTEEGVARNNGGAYSYEYFLKDHLGNTRATFYRNPTTGQAEVLQREDYYAFGLRKVPPAQTSSSETKYLYNGKELQEELGQYDYKRRFYDPVIGRFISVDPVAEHFPWMTTYQYASNNPSSKIDLDGLEGIFPWMAFGNSSFVPRMAPLAEASRVPGGLQNLAKAGGEIAGKPVGELIRTAERTVKSEEHHLMPKGLKGNDVIDAAREGGFKFEGAENKISLDKFERATGEGQHGNHPSYNETVGQKLTEFAKNNPEYSTTDALKFVRGLTQEMRQMIENNPAVKVNELFKVKSVAPLDNTKVVRPNMLPAKKKEEQQYDPTML